MKMKIFRKVQRNIRRANQLEPCFCDIEDNILERDVVWQTINNQRTRTDSNQLGSQVWLANKLRIEVIATKRVATHSCDATIVAVDPSNKKPRVIRLKQPTVYDQQVISRF